jgi:hypothetical protein
VRKTGHGRMEVDGLIMMVEADAEVAPEAGAPEAGAPKSSHQSRLRRSWWTSTVQGLGRCDGRCR